MAGVELQHLPELADGYFEALRIPQRHGVEVPVRRRARHELEGLPEIVRRRACRPRLHFHARVASANSLFKGLNARPEERAGFLCVREALGPLAGGLGLA